MIVSLDAGRSTALKLLDVSAAFNTIDHSILLNRLKCWFVVSLTALNLLSSFLTGSSQVVVTSNVKSQPNLLEYGVPQCSMLGLLFSVHYSTPFCNI